MKITHVTTRVLRTPADNPLVVGLPAPTDTREFVTLELGTDQGLVGIGLTFFGGALTPALKAAVDALAGLIVGDDPAQVEAIAAKCRRAAGGSGPGGIFTLALSAVDIACWDLKGKALGQLGLRAPRRPARPRAHVRERRPDAPALARLPGQGGAAPARHGLPPDEDAVRQRADAGRLDRARAGHARGDRPRRRSHVRHQPALERQPRHRGRPPHRALPALLAGGPDHPRRLPGPRADRRRARHARSPPASTTTASCPSVTCSRRARSTS